MDQSTLPHTWFAPYPDHTCVLPIPKRSNKISQHFELRFPAHHFPLKKYLRLRLAPAQNIYILFLSKAFEVLLTDIIKIKPLLDPLNNTLVEPYIILCRAHHES